MLLRMPAPPAVSTMRGVALPSRGSSVVPFRIIAPIASDEKFSTASNSVPQPYVPDATRIGVLTSSLAPRRARGAVLRRVTRHRPHHRPRAARKYARLAARAAFGAVQKVIEHLRG